MPEMLGCSLMEYLVLACYFKALNICKAIVGSVGVVEVNFHGVPYNLHLLEGHAFAEESFHSVGLTECLEGKTFAYRLFLARVNLFLTFTENWIEKLGLPISASWAIAVATRISWNIWQMDGLRDTVPGTDTLCLIFNWEENKKVTFRQIKEESDNV